MKTTTLTASNIAKTMTKKGNAIGFTANGDTVCCEGRRDGSWRICCTVGPDATLGLILTDPRTCTFATKSDAAAYALTLIDPAKTVELAWW